MPHLIIFVLVLAISPGSGLHPELLRNLHDLLNISVLIVINHDPGVLVQAHSDKHAGMHLSLFRGASDFHESSLILAQDVD